MTVRGATDSAGLLRAVFQADEQERAALAVELHEGVGQALKALALGIERLEGCEPAARQRLKHLASETLEVVRRLALDLRPATLDELGLAAALRAEARAASERAQEPLAVHVHADVPERPRARAGEAPPEEVALFRVAQEALRNVVLHARARTASVTLTATPDCWQLVVEDDGEGFETLQLGEPERLGLTSARARLVALGGELSVESRVGGGTSVYGTVPRV